MKRLSLLLLLVASAAYGEIYTYTDARGTSHYVSSQYDIPPRYLSRAKVYDVATGKKLPLSAAPAPGGGAQPAAPPQGPAAPPQQGAPAAPPAVQHPAPAIQQPAPRQQAPAQRPPRGRATIEDE